MGVVLPLFMATPFGLLVSAIAIIIRKDLSRTAFLGLLLFGLVPGAASLALELLY